MSEVRTVPFYCPFCGEPTIRPADPMGWRCESCGRGFELTVTSIGGAD
jgi:ribosomal protein L37AE/L43A